MKKQKRNFWLGKMRDMLKNVPDSGLTKNRYRAERFLLAQKYPELSAIPMDRCIEMIQELLYIDRKMRQLTEGEEVALKKTLSQEAQVELGYQIQDNGKR